MAKQYFRPLAFSFVLLCATVAVFVYLSPPVSSQGVPIAPSSSPVDAAGTDWYTAVQKGLVDGHSIVHKFGAATLTTTLSPVTSAGVYRTPSTATALEVVSDDAQDSPGGSGALSVEIQGLGPGWTALTQTVALNGLTPVAVPTSYFRVHRISVVPSGTYATASQPSHDSTITIRESGGGDVWATVTNNVGIGEAQSNIGAYSIPTGVTGYLLSTHESVDSTKSVNLSLFRRCDADDVVAPYDGTLRLLRQLFGLAGPADSRTRSPGTPLVGPCDLIYMGEISSGTGDAEVRFELLLVDD